MRVEDSPAIPFLQNQKSLKMSALTSRLDAKLIEDAAKALIKYERKQEQEGESRKLIEERPKWVLLQVGFDASLNILYVS
ncbi:hypothetical protein EON65_25870 [archaeon]|nr:MAG: hypothetical protein EON65_25870 [archaeon]